MPAPRLVALPVAADFHPEVSCGPRIVYDDRPTITFDNRNEQYVRASFERWDALRVCRGEYSPYSFEPPSPPAIGQWPRFFVVENSPWLPDRYAYEKQHYGDAYGFGGNVDEMLTDFDHYVLSFHDEFVEVIAGGIWFELSDHPFVEDEWQADHPLRDLGPEHRVETFEYSGIACEVRRNQMPLDELRRRALLCAQPLVAFLFRLRGETEHTVAFTLSLRERRGQTTCVLRPWLGGEKARYSSIPAIDELRPIFLGYLDEVIARRRQMGLD
jgi:hypothetical protein